ncbi:MAG: ATP-dependent DNA helicase RecG [Thermomicrobiales bacterium]
MDRTGIATSLDQDRVASDDARARLDTAVENLRREWRAGCRAGNSYQAALGSVRRLRGNATSEQLAADLAAVVAALEHYPSLSPDQRQEALKHIAAALKRLTPRFAASGPARPTGTLESAVRPARKAVSTPEPVISKRSESAPATPTVVARQPPRVAAATFALDDPVTDLKGAGGATSKKLAKLGVETIGDLLFFAPRRHIDYSRTIRIGEALNLRPGSEVTVRGRVTDLQVHRGPGAPRVTIRLADSTGWVRVTWFNQYLGNVLKVGDEIAVSGAIESGYGALSLTGPEWERMSGPDAGTSTGRVVPVYPLTAGLSQKMMRGFARQALAGALGAVEEYLPDAVLRPAPDSQLLSLPDAIAQIHYPDSDAALHAARERLAFDDLFLLQLGLVQRKAERQAHDGIPIPVDEALQARWAEGLPFRLTGAQRSALAEVIGDLRRDKPMARLLQGDVGSGKTAVAAGAMLAATAAGFQAAMMAPTEILAEQHLAGVERLYSGLPEADRPRIRLLTGATKAAARKEIRAGLIDGDIDILIGTHAIIQDGIEFSRLALAVVDEQHRFGVRQRAALPGKGAARPHQLAMTATPIPRTLNHVLHGDLDVSILAERPPGRIPIETRRYVGAERAAAYDLVRQEVASGHQVFVICPLVEASDAIEAKAAVDEAQRLQDEVFPDLRVATLHGRMSSREKDAVMSEFRDRKSDLLVSTSVIEVGIDIPNATVMLIEGADRFGLAQLHQFRGRVGRGGARSYCLLLAEEASPDGEERLQAMVASDDGFLLAEKDLQLRGPGDFIGTRQSGLPEMPWLEMVFDTRLLDRARRAAESILEADSELRQSAHRRLRQRLAEFWARGAPDQAV